MAQLHAAASAVRIAYDLVWTETHAPTVDGLVEKRQHDIFNCELIVVSGKGGVGKTTIAEMVARELTGNEPCAIEDHNGREITIEVVRRWMDGLAYRGLFGGVKAARIVNELDRCSREAQDLLLTYLDRMPSDRAFLGTSNLQLDLLT